MFIEGFWLYAGVFFLKYTKWHYMKIKACLIGWFVPAAFMTIWGTGEHILSYLNISETIKDKGFWAPMSVSCLLVPVYLILTTNSIMMIRVLYKLRQMLKESNGDSTYGLMRRLARATFVLSFLLGLNYAIPLIIFSLHIPALENNACAILNIQLINSVVSSLQGFFVAVFYVLSNKEVRQFFRTQLPADLPSLPTPMSSPRVPRRHTYLPTPTGRRKDRSSRLSSSSRTSQSSSNLSPSSAEQSRQTSMTSQGSSLHVPSIRSSQDSRTSKGSSLLDVPSARVSRLSETSETSITLHVPQIQARSNSDGYQFLSRNDDNDSVFV